LQDYSAPGTYGRYLRQLESRLRQIPGVRAAGFIQYLPLQNWGWWGRFSIPGRPASEADSPQSELRYVSPGYFQAMGIPIRGGRAFTDADTEHAAMVILINEALARRYFPNENPVGRLTSRGTIAGVVGDVRTSRLDRAATPEIYYSFAQNTAATSDAGVALAVRTEVLPESVAAAVREAIHQVNPRQALFDVKTMKQVIADSLADINLYLWLIGIFAGIAALLAISGIYGVIAYVVTARTQEFGIRLALGAHGSQILRLVLGRGAGLVACGIALGVAGALAAGRVLRLLSGVISADPATLAAVGIVSAAVAMAACYIPARRAMRIDPNLALKYE
jgi:predicted permease